MSVARSRIRVDVRFFIGVALVLASIAGVWFVVTAARSTTTVVAAVDAIVPGQRITGDAVRSVEVALGPSADRYLTAADMADGAVAARTIGAGELVPRDAVLIGADADTTTVVVDSAVPVPSAVAPGAVVDVWLAADARADNPEPARILVSGATVVTVIEATSMVRSGTVRVEVVVPRTAVARLLDAQAGTGSLAVIPSGGGG